MRAPNIFGWTAIDAGPANDPKWLAVKNVRFAPTPFRYVTTLAGLAHQIDQMVNNSMVYANEPLTEWRVPAQDRDEGNCIDYALIKRAYLISHGVSPDWLALLIVMDQIAHQQHALLLVDTGTDFLVLDSFNSLTLPASQVTNYQPIVAYGDTEEWVYGHTEETKAA